MYFLKQVNQIIHGTTTYNPTPLLKTFYQKPILFDSIKNRKV